MDLITVDAQAYIFFLLIFLAFTLGPAIVMTIIGLATRQKNPKRAKILFILSAIYVLIAGGICGTMFMG